MQSLWYELKFSAPDSHKSVTQLHISALVLIFFIGTRAELTTRAKAKTRVFESLLGEFSTEGIFLSCKGMQ